MIGVFFNNLNTLVPQNELQELEISISNCSDTLVPPRITARNPEVSVSVGEVAELECVAHGNPQV